VCQTVWQQEATKWWHLRDLTFSPILGTPEERKAALDKNADIYLINYENLEWLSRQGRRPWSCIVYDELSKLSSPQAKRTKAAVKMLGHVSRTIGLTATPATNGLTKLFGQYLVMDGGKRLGRYVTHFRNIYCSVDYLGYNYTVLPHMKGAIYKAINDVTYSIPLDGDTPQEVPFTTQRISVPLPDHLRKQYKQLEKELYTDLEDGSASAVSAGTLVQKLLQFCNGAVYGTDSSINKAHDLKIEALQDLVESLGDQSLFICYSFKSDARRIKKVFPNAVDVSNSQITEVLEDWDHGKIPILMGHPGSCGHGLNLQYGGHHICWFGLPFDLELYIQANGRLIRTGQRKQVIVHEIIIEDSIEERVAKVLKNKKATQTELIEAIKSV